MKVECKNCKWWGYWKVNEKEGVRVGKCHRYPPKFSLCDIDRVRPTTSELDFCGEFVDRAKEKE